MLGKAIKDRFMEFKKKYPVIGDVRGLGCMIGVELIKKDGSENPEAFEHIRSFSAKNGLALLCCGPQGNIIRMIPPIIATRSELDKGLEIIEKSLKDCPY